LREEEKKKEKKKKNKLNINLEERIIDNSMCIFILESILLSTFLPF
jgi:hypothetical protein